MAATKQESSANTAERDAGRGAAAPRRRGGAALPIAPPAGRLTEPEQDQPPPDLSPQQDTQNSRRINKAGKIPGE